MDSDGPTTDVPRRSKIKRTKNNTHESNKERSRLFHGPRLVLIAPSEEERAEQEHNRLQIVSTPNSAGDTYGFTRVRLWDLFMSNCRTKADQAKFFLLKVIEGLSFEILLHA